MIEEILDRMKLSKKQKNFSKFYLIIFLLISVTACSNLKKICIDNQCFKVEIAQTPEEHSQGLMFKTNLLKNEGILFIFEEEKKVSFWMKNTLIPLDIIWINKTKTVIGVTKAKPCKEDPCQIYNSPDKIKYALEVNQDSRIKEGELKF